MTDAASGHRDSACSHCAVDTVTEDSRGLLPSRPCACVTYGENPVAADADCSRIHFGYPPQKRMMDSVQLRYQDIKVTVFFLAYFYRKGTKARPFIITPVEAHYICGCFLLYKTL